MSRRSARKSSSTATVGQGNSVATLDRPKNPAPKKERRPTQKSEKPNKFGLVLIESFELKPTVRLVGMDYLYRRDNPYKIKHTGPSLDCIRNKEFRVQAAKVHVYELLAGGKVSHLDLIEALGDTAALSNPAVLDECFRRPELLTEERPGQDTDIVTNFLYFQNGEGPLAVCVERQEDSPNWRLFSESMYDRNCPREAHGRCRFIVCGGLKV